jgi:hypothetical protein
MDQETWMDANEAMDFGFVDDITEKIDMAACAKFIPIMSKAGFKHIPSLGAKDAEKALRDAGFSRKEAKSILAKGLVDGLRDADQNTPQVSVDNTQRDVEPPKPKKDRTADLLTRAEMIAPTSTN